MNTISAVIMVSIFLRTKHFKRRLYHAGLIDISYRLCFYQVISVLADSIDLLKWYGLIPCHVWMPYVGARIVRSFRRRRISDESARSPKWCAHKWWLPASSQGTAMCGHAIYGLASLLAQMKAILWGPSCLLLPLDVMRHHRVELPSTPPPLLWA